MNEFEKIFIGAIATIITGSIIALINRNSKHHDDIIELKGKVTQLEDQHNTGMDQLKEIVNLRLKGLEDKISHMDQNIQQSSVYFKVLIEEFKKSNK